MKKLFFNQIYIIIILLNLNSIYCKNLLCPNNHLINVGLKTPKGISLITINEKKYQSKLTQEEREKYEEEIDLKRSFSATIDKVYDSFCPEKDDYWDGLNYITLIFFFISLIPIVIILIYFILRFLCNKCSGPRKITDITRFKRNCTWIVLILSTIVVFILFTIILVYSVKINNDVNTTFDRASELINNNAYLYTKISETIEAFKNLKLNTPDNELMNSFKSNMDKYVETTNEHTDKIKTDDNHRNLTIILLYVYYLIAIILSYLFFFLKWKLAEGILFILLLFTVPAMFVVDGYNFKFFFFYSDLCGAINGALYSKEFPVAGQSLGYYYNCFDRETRAQLYAIRFTLYNSAISSINNQEEAMDKYNKLNNEVLYSQFNCELVTEIVPKIENEFCKDNLWRVNEIFTLMIWLISFTFIMAIGVRMAENLIWKKKVEIENMIENLEQIY